MHRSLLEAGRLLKMFSVASTVKLVVHQTGGGPDKYE